VPNLDIDKIQLLVAFVAPGFVSLKVWGILNSSPRFRLSESLTEAVVYDSWNALFFVGLFNALERVHHLLAYGVVCVLLPILWPVLVYSITKTRYLRTKMTPTAWDYFFYRREDCFLLLHLKNGVLLGGLFSTKSFASSFPEKEILYLSQLWKLDKDGRFKEPLKMSGGLLVNYDEVSFIEIFNLDFQQNETPDKDRKDGKPKRYRKARLIVR
jgi:hypothetical protein